MQLQLAARRTDSPMLPPDEYKRGDGWTAIIPHFAKLRLVSVVVVVLYGTVPVIVVFYGTVPVKTVLLSLTE